MSSSRTAVVVLGVLSLLAYSSLGFKPDHEFTVQLMDDTSWYFFWNSLRSQLTNESRTWKNEVESIISPLYGDELRARIIANVSLTIAVNGQPLVSKIYIDKPENYPEYVPVLQNSEVTLSAPAKLSSCSWTAYTEELTPQGDVEVNSYFEGVFNAPDDQPEDLDANVRRAEAVLVSKGLGQRELTFRCRGFDYEGKLYIGRTLRFKIDSITV